MIEESRTMKSQLLKSFYSIACCLPICFFVLLSGCEKPPVAEKPESESIIGKTTQDIGEYDGDAEIADLQVDKNSSPVGAAAGTYKFALGKTSEFAIQKSLQLYNAQHGEYPKDHAEFMAKIVKANNIRLPVLPGKLRYQYDVENHKLVVVEAAVEAEEAAAESAE